jgi:putative hemolysin
MIFANGLFAMSEIAIVSSRKARLESRAAEGSKGARAALELANEPTQMLSTVQIGITLIGILTGAFGGATLSTALSKVLKTIPLLAPQSDVLALAIVVAGITYLSLVVGELVPKKMALNNPETIACMVAIPMRFFAKLAMPLVHLLSVSTEMALKLLRVKKPDEPPVTEEEVKDLIAEGTKYGTFEETERDMVEKIFRLGDLKISWLMTPRTQVAWLDTEDTEENNLQVLVESGHSRFPVARGSLDDLLGVVYTKDLLASRLSCQALDVEGAVRAPLYVPKSMKVFKVLEMFKESGTHIAFVIDEYGGLLGIVTLNDIMSEIVGDIEFADAQEEPEIIRREDGTWLLDGMLAIDELKDLFDLDELPGEERDHFQTLGGFILSYLGHIPAAAEYFEWNGLRFEVLDMDRVRIDKVLVTKLPEEKNELDQLI